MRVKTQLIWVWELAHFGTYRDEVRGGFMLE